MLCDEITPGIDQMSATNRLRVLTFCSSPTFFIETLSLTQNLSFVAVKSETVRGKLIGLVKWQV